MLLYVLDLDFASTYVHTISLLYYHPREEKDTQLSNQMRIFRICVYITFEKHIHT
jgi:hypothetical protein